ncbi:MAG: hypothetical protein KJP04_01540 [Arenicella sp.]|nr:hypothetical protein [Arenicella sp.]
MTYIDAMELLNLYAQDSTQVLGWEAWIQYPDGSLSRLLKNWGTVDLSSMPKSSAIALAKSMIMQAYTEWQEKPEVENALLLFSIAVNT